MVVACFVFVASVSFRLCLRFLKLVIHFWIKWSLLVGGCSSEVMWFLLISVCNLATWGRIWGSRYGCGLFFFFCFRLSSVFGNWFCYLWIWILVLLEDPGGSEGSVRGCFLLFLENNWLLFRLIYAWNGSPDFYFKDKSVFWFISFDLWFHSFMCIFVKVITSCPYCITRFIPSKFK